MNLIDKGLSAACAFAKAFSIFHNTRSLAQTVTNGKACDKWKTLEIVTRSATLVMDVKGLYLDKKITKASADLTDLKKKITSYGDVSTTFSPEALDKIMVLIGSTVGMEEDIEELKEDVLKLKVMGFVLHSLAQYSSDIESVSGLSNLLRVHDITLHYCENSANDRMVDITKVSMTALITAAVLAEFRKNYRANRAIEQRLPSDFPDNAVFGRYVCPITLGPIRYPVTVHGVDGPIDAQTFERDAIEAWLASHNTNPLTNQILNRNQLQPNLEIQDRIEAEMQNLGLAFN